jgi:MFS family permease
MPLVTEPAAALRRLHGLVFCNFLALGILIAGVPRFLFQQLNATRFQVGFATTIYFVSALAVRLFVGVAVERFGRRPFMIYPPIVTAAITLVYTQAHSVAHIALLRLAGGVVASLFFTAAALAATDLAPADQRSRVLGKQSVATYSAFAIGPVIADELIRHSWTLVWVIPAVLHLLTAVIGSTIGETRPPDLARSASRNGFERRAVRPAFGLLAANFAFATLVSFLPEYTKRLGISRPGVLFAVYAISVLLVRAFTGSLADRMGPARFTMPALTVGASALVLLALSPTPWTSYIAIALVGLSVGATFPAATAAAMERTDGDRARTMGTALAVGDIGQATAGPLVGWLSGEVGFRWIYIIPAVVCLACVAVIATLPEARTRRGDLAATSA